MATTINLQEELQKEIDKKFHSPEKFAQEIENLVKKNQDYNYINAIIDYCENNDIDVELVPKLMTKPLKEKIKWDAMELHFLKKSSLAKLPL